MWNVSKQKIVKTVLCGRTSSVYCVALNQDSSRVVSGSADGTIRIWGISDPKDEKFTVGKTEDRKIIALCASSGRKVVVAGYNDGRMRIWNSEIERTREIGLINYNRRVGSIAMNNDERCIVSGSKDSTICIWNAMTGGQIGDNLYGHEASVSAVAVSHDCRWFVSASFDKILCL